MSNYSEHPLYQLMDLAHDVGTRKGVPATTQMLLEGILINVMKEGAEADQAIRKVCERMLETYSIMREAV